MPSRPRRREDALLVRRAAASAFCWATSSSRGGDLLRGLPREDLRSRRRPPPSSAASPRGRPDLVPSPLICAVDRRSWLPIVSKYSSWSTRSPRLWTWRRISKVSVVPALVELDEPLLEVSLRDRVLRFRCSIPRVCSSTRSRAAPAAPRCAASSASSSAISAESAPMSPPSASIRWLAASISR